MSYLQREDNRQVYYEDHGSGARAMVLVHGWGMSVRAWDHVLPALLAADQRVVLLDHRGCGQSDKDFADMSISAIASDLVALVDELGLEKVVLKGWSLGGPVVVEAAANLGERCSALVLTGGATPVYVQKPDFPHGGTEEDMAGTLVALSTDRVNFLHGLSQIVCATDVGANIENWFWRIFLESSPAASATLGELAQLDQREMLTSLDVPILSFVGSEDGFVAPTICRWVGEHHSNARVVEFDGVGHAPFIEAQAQYLEELIAFANPHLRSSS
jgi:pimeloyl-ACP methyl ester carboxylesterase